MTGGLRRDRDLITTAVGALVVFAIAFTLYTRHNDYPARLHPDEPSKIAQLLEGQWNFFHPQLLLTTTRVADRLIRPAGQDPWEYVDTGWGSIPIGPRAQRTVEVGRWVSAGFAAGAVAFLAWAVALAYGRGAGAAAAAVALGVSTLVFVGHYFKEDSALAFGIAFTLFAIALLERHRIVPMLILLGIAAGVASSGKYVGLAMVPVAAGAAAALWPRRDARSRLTAAGLVAGVAAAVFLAINLEMLRHLRPAIEGMRFELEHVVFASESVAADRLSLNYLPMLAGAVSWPVWIAAAVAVGWHAWTWRQRTTPQRLLLVFPLAWLIFMSLSAVQGVRYILPAILVIHALGGVGAVVAAGWMTKRRAPRAALATLLVALIAVPGAIEVREAMDQFANDSRLRLRAWVADEMPADARLAQDYYAGLPSGEPGVDPRLVKTRKYILADEDMHGLRSLGVTHVAVAEPAYGRFFLERAQPGSAVAEDYAEYRRRYEELFERADLVWEAGPPRRLPVATNPLIRVYRLPDE